MAPFIKQLKIWIKEFKAFNTSKPEEKSSFEVYTEALNSIFSSVFKCEEKKEESIKPFEFLLNKEKLISCFQ